MTTLLNKLVRGRGWTYGSFAAAYERAAAEVSRSLGDSHVASATVSEATFRRWTSGRLAGTPQWPAPAVLEHLLGHPASALLAAPDPTEAPGALASTISESELQMTAQDAAGHASDAAAQAVSDLTIDQIEDDTKALARSYHARTPGEVYERGTELMKAARSLLDRTQRTRQRSRLFLVSGQIAAILASVSFDLGSLTSAVQLARTAALYGEVVEDGPLQAYAGGALAYLAYWDGRPADALRFVRQAQQREGLGDTARTRLATIEARAHAHLGDPQSTIRTIDSLDGGRGETDALHDGIAGEFGMPADRVSMSHATSYLVAKEFSRAELAAEEALRIVASVPKAQRSRATMAKARVELSRVRLFRSDLDGAAEALAPVLALETRWRTAGLLERITALRAELARAQLSDAVVARDLGTRIEDYTAMPAGQVIAPASRLALG